MSLRRSLRLSSASAPAVVKREVKKRARKTTKPDLLEHVISPNENQIENVDSDVGGSDVETNDGSSLDIYDSNDNNEIDRLQSMDRDTALEFIKENYSNPESIICYSSITGLKKIFKALTDEEIKSVLSQFESFSLMKSSRNNHEYNPFISHNLRDVFQMVELGSKS